MDLSKRAQNLLPSGTLAVVGKAKRLKREGKPVISFGAGEPDFSSPSSALKYATDAIENGKTHYTPATGIPELKEAIASYYRTHFDLEYDPEQIVVGAGAKPLLYEAMGCLLDEGDEVIIFAPAWVSYVEQIRLFGGKEVIVDTKDTSFVPDPVKIKKAITPRTKCMILNTPNNPTGSVYNSKLLKAIADIALENNIVLVYDEIYERLVYGDASHHEIVKVEPRVRDLTVIINGVSKAYAMTGWRIGYAIGPNEIISKMGAIQGHMTSNPCSIAQWAALGAIRHAEPDIETMRVEFSKRRDLILSLLEDMPLISFQEPRGAFYVWINVEKTFGLKYKGLEISNDSSFCSLLLDHEFVAAVPGNAFLGPGNIRVSYSNSEEEITEGMKRLSRFLKEIG